MFNNRFPMMLIFKMILDVIVEQKKISEMKLIICVLLFVLNSSNICLGQDSIRIDTVKSDLSSG